MNFPSAEFDDAVAAVCQGTGSEAGIAILHATLRAREAARDDYLWQVELHARLASMAHTPINAPALLVNEKPRFPSAKRLALVKWAVAAAVLIAFGGGLYWQRWNTPAPNGNISASRKDGRNMSRADDSKPLLATGEFGFEGILRTTARFARACDAPIIVGTGGQEPIELGAEVPYEHRGDTLHVWNWSRSRQSRVMKDVRLLPDQTFCLSPDGTLLVWAQGHVLNLTNGERSTIDLGGAFHVDQEGGTLRRIAHLQFTPDGRRLALLLSNLVLTKSSHPLRRQDLTTAPTLQVVDFPSGKLVCEFPAGNEGDHLPLAFSADGKRAVAQYYQGKSGSRIVERSALTGEIRREYEPHLREYARAIGLSADGSLLAACDSEGDALLWDTLTGKLKHKLSLPRLAGRAHLRFSPDGKLLAFSLFSLSRPSSKLVVIDVADGAIVATVSQEESSGDTSGDIHWSADSKSFDVISDLRGIAGHQVLYNMYPSVRTWKIDDIRKP